MEEDIILLDAEERMEKTVDSLKANYATLRTGRAVTSMLDRIEIDYYVNLVRIKKAEKAENPELDYQLKVQKNKLAALGVNTENYEF